LNTLTNSKNCSESRVKFLFWLSYTLIGRLHSWPAFEQLTGSQVAFVTTLRVTGSHRLKMELQVGRRSPKFIWAPVYSCICWLRPRKSPATPHLGSHSRALLVSKIDDISLWPPAGSSQQAGTSFLERVTKSIFTISEGDFIEASRNIIMEFLQKKAKKILQTIRAHSKCVLLWFLWP